VAETWDVIVVGGGHNGLIAAAYMARSGLRVLVLERRHLVGGASVTEEVFPGFRISTAAYLCSLLQENIIRDLDLVRHGYRVYPKDPSHFLPFPDGRYLLLWQDLKKSCTEIARFSGTDAAAFPEYEKFVERLAAFADDLLLRTPPNLLTPRIEDLLQFGKLGWKFLRMSPLERVGLIRIFTQSVAEFLEPWFESEALKVSLATDGVIGFNGGPRTPGSAYVLLHHVMGKMDGRRGLWGFVRGGMGGLSESIAAAARSSGAVIRTEAPVERIMIRNGRGEGVVLAGGEEVRSRVVVSNADPKRTFLTLVGEEELSESFVAEVRRIRMTGSSMKINLALDGLPNFRAIPGASVLPHHGTTIHICPDLEYIEKAWDQAKYGRPSDRPLLEMTIPTVYDDSLAPPGKHVMNIFLQYAPYELKGARWDEIRDDYADHVIRLIDEYAPGFSSLILARQVISPLDLEQTFGLTGGNIFHGEMSVDQLFILRPVPGWSRYRTPIRGLYLCGSGTHPGGGVMGAPGFNAAREILRDWRRGAISR
jgi:phytoene dehydrogenase-like protein